jgi:curli biogenesis system outer membrane secretion channel CsgG
VPKRIFPVVCLVGMLSVMMVASVWAADKPAVAVMQFKDGNLTNWWGSSWELTDGVTNLVIDEIVKSDRLTVVERTRLDELIGEQDLADDGRVEAETASQIGKLTGARLMVMGTVTQFDFKQSASVGIASFLRLSGSQAKVKLTGRVVDTQNGRVLGSFSGEGSKTGAGISVDTMRGVSFDAEQFQGSTLGTATVAAVKSFVAELIKTTDKVATEVATQQEQLSQSGTVVAVLDGDQIVITLGSKHGMRLNSKVDIAHMQEIAGLKNPVRIPVGTAKLISVDEEASVAVMESKTRSVEVGDVVTPK